MFLMCRLQLEADSQILHFPAFSWRDQGPVTEALGALSAFMQ
jgi:hypothetical protein